MGADYDLRTALAHLRQSGVEATEVLQPIDPEVELVDDYLAAYQRPHGSWLADEQPLRLYRQPTRGDFPVLLGVFGSRRNCRHLLDPHARHPDNLSNAHLVMRAAGAPVGPRSLARPEVPRTIVSTPDLHSALPVLRYARDDPGPTVTLGLVYARDRHTGHANCSYHRITLKSHSVVVGIDPGGDLRKMLDAHVARGEALPISVNIGLDPAIYLASVLTRPCVEYGFDELGAAGALRGTAVRVAPCFSNGGRFIDHAEIVIEGSLGLAQEPESPDAQGLSMPEYLGYRSPCGRAATLRVQALSHRPGALYQTLSGPGFEQSALLGLGQECSVLAKLMAWNRTELVRAVVALPSGGGHLLTVLQVAKRDSCDDREAVAVARALLEEISSLKNLILVDEDVDPHSLADLLWAMSTRTRLDLDVHTTGPLPGNPLDPSQSRGYAPGNMSGLTRKSIVDCTVPYRLRHRFQRTFGLRRTPVSPPA